MASVLALTVHSEVAVVATAAASVPTQLVSALASVIWPSPLGPF